MSINFSTLQGLTIPEGVVTQITDASGNVLWSAVEPEPIVLEVAKITSDTYVSSTSYTSEEFILLNIYPKTNGTVKITYGGLTKTITDTSGAGEPNAQQVFFGTFNGVSDEVETPANGTLTIEGDYRGVGVTSFNVAKTSVAWFNGVTSVVDLGSSEVIPLYAFYNCTEITNVTIPGSVTAIDSYAFKGCTGLTSMTIPSNVKEIGSGVWEGYCSNIDITVVSGNNVYKIDGNCLIEISTNILVCGFKNVVIPSYVEKIGEHAFYERADITNVTVPTSVTYIDMAAFYLTSGNSRTVMMLSDTPPTLASYDYPFNQVGTNNIVVPVGSVDTYKAASVWSDFADYITEAS